MKRILILLVVSCASLNLTAQKDTLKVLFVGNSYTNYNNLSHVVSLISDYGSTKLETRKSVKGGAHIWEHWLEQRGLQSRSLVASGDFDVVVLQDHSMGAIEYPDSLIKYMRLFAELARENGAETYLYNTWAREKLPQMQSQINAVYLEAATRSGANVIPVGDAWAYASDLRPTIKLYAPDGSHPSIYGSFLTACTMVRKITGEIPASIHWSLDYKDSNGEYINLIFFDQLDTEFFRQVADQVVNDQEKEW
ncbi:MAG: hypothetical protein CMB80_21290 [Flammeovirgaceae bacterium]|nr:hypothetical protein [Flammeovirgaceae bacterium]MBR06859.1 hypothetical protein [Rickettsiales bacterium]HCX24144.1 hypothetical protein [Cytophagales bacterium]|tara:strand:- start:112 stop:864 length:753 start_codon:yes stop_codon:yes gene_type:complete